MSLLRATLLFILLSPGFLLTIPPIGKLFMSRKTSVAAVFVHALVFYFALKFSSSIPLVNMVEGFEERLDNAPKKPNGSACGGDTECQSSFCNNRGKCAPRHGEGVSG
jgi:hypothetical protein